MREAKVYIGASYKTTFFGPGRPEFNPKEPMPKFTDYIAQAAQGVLDNLGEVEIDEGVIGSFMPARFLHQAHIAAFLPTYIPQLINKPCVGVEAACATGGKVISQAIRAVLSGKADAVIALGFEVQNTVKPIYGADILAGAGYYAQERKKGHAHFFPGVFSERAEAYYAKYGYEATRRGMAQWYEQMIFNARRDPKAQEHYNQMDNLFENGMTKPNKDVFLPGLNHYDCSKISDGAAALLVLSEKGVSKCGLDLSQVTEIVGIGEAEGDITQPPHDLTRLSTSHEAARKAFEDAGIKKEDLALIEIHDCFTITALLALEALGFAAPGKASEFIMNDKISPDGRIPANLSGGLIGFGHPTGATGVRMMADLHQQLTGKASNQISPRTPYGMMLNMGGNDKTACSFILRSAES